MIQLTIEDDGTVTTLVEPMDTEGSETLHRLLDVFGEALVLQQRKAQTYGDAWRSQGEMGNVARVLSKAARIKKMLWNSNQLASVDESAEDTLLDMINLAAFTILNRRDRNKWGN